MKRLRAVAVLMLTIFFVTMVVGAVFAADKIEVKGKIKDYDLNKKTVVVTVDGKDMSFEVLNEGAMRKLGDRLDRGDEVKIKYTTEGGKNVVKGFMDLRGTKPGC